MENWAKFMLPRDFAPRLQQPSVFLSYYNLGSLKLQVSTSEKLYGFEEKRNVLEKNTVLTILGQRRNQSRVNEKKGSQGLKGQE